MHERREEVRARLLVLIERARVEGVRWSARRRQWVSVNVTTGPVLAAALNDLEAELMQLERKAT